MITFFAQELDVAPSSVLLDDDAAQHARARRLQGGEPIRLVDGKGRIASGRIATIGRGELRADIDRVVNVGAPRALDVLIPVADKERMLWIAEKCVELQITRWTPVVYARSRSVAPRGEGPKFREKVVARMRSALEQSGGAWLPVVETERDMRDAFASVGRAAVRVLLDANGDRLSAMPLNDEVALAVGPEGGLESEERTTAVDLGWRPAAIGATTLRFETAAIAGVSVVRASQLNEGGR